MISDKIIYSSTIPKYSFQDDTLNKLRGFSVSLVYIYEYDFPFTLS